MGYTELSGVECVTPPSACWTVPLVTDVTRRLASSEKRPCSLHGGLEGADCTPKWCQKLGVILRCDAECLCSFLANDQQGGRMVGGNADDVIHPYMAHIWLWLCKSVEI